MIRPACFVNRWQYEPEGADVADFRQLGDNGLMKAIDVLVDAILTPWQEARGYGGFTLRVKTFFRENNMALEPPKVHLIPSVITCRAL
jgi:hypothetical protein